MAGISTPRRPTTTWTRSLLPFTSKPTKPIRKSRKRSALTTFIFSNLFLITLSISILFFLLIFYLYAFPKPIFPTTRPTTTRPIRFRKPGRVPLPSNGSGLFVNDAVSAVDLTTKGLYDRIEFKDVDGGPWKQGWRVNYKGDEWNDERLKVFVVPHSHNDPGWKLTVEEYYDRQSRHILDTIVDTLVKDERRKFIWEEMSYLERWWRDAPDAKRKRSLGCCRMGSWRLLEVVGL